MAYCRFARNSDLYLFADTSGGLTCCGCQLVSPPGTNGKSFRCGTRSEMIGHIEDHRAAGHRIEQGVVEELREELAEHGESGDLEPMPTSS